MTISVRRCPGCKQERPEDEILCGHCRWDLIQEPLYISGYVESIEEINFQPYFDRLCINGHIIDINDEMCFKCGAVVRGENKNPRSNLSQMVIDDWLTIERINIQSDFYEQYMVERDEKRALLTYYYPNAHPDPSIYEILYKLPKENIPELITHGEWQGRSYDVFDYVSRENILDLFKDCLVNLENVREIVKILGKTIDTLGNNRIRHGDIRPENILINRREPLNLMVIGFHCAYLSTYDLDIAVQHNSAWYTAPEVIAGSINIASDWWSLGMIILHLVTKGKCFEGVNEQAFRIHVVTRGVSIPRDIDSTVYILLCGLLARDPDQRWQWSQIKSWLSGEPVDIPVEYDNVEAIQNGPSILLNDSSYICLRNFALAASEAENWEFAKDLLIRGVITSWLEDRSTDSRITIGVRLSASLEAIPDDFRLALALMCIYPSLPLIYRGEIVNSDWLLKNPVQGYEIITGPLVTQLRHMNKESHIVALYERQQKVRDRAKNLEIELDEDIFKIMVLVPSRSKLEKQWEVRRQLFPGSDHKGLNSIMDRQKLREDELLILLSATVQQFESSEQILSKAKEIAVQVGLDFFKTEIAQKWFNFSRREIYREIEARIVQYSKCGIPRIDEWADDFRIARRIPLARALVLLSVPVESWQEPPRQQYICSILEFFEKRIKGIAQRGPLVRMKIGKSSPRIDLSTLSSKKSTPALILEHLVSRVEVPIEIDQSAFELDPFLKRRLNHLVAHAKVYRRDTGIDSLNLGFPFVVIKASNTEITTAKPKIAPLLLWPIRIDLEGQDRGSILFDRDREDVQLNPALIALIGLDVFKKWNEVLKELLGRSSLYVCDVIDAFGALIECRERSLCALPSIDYELKKGINTLLVCSAVLFHAEYAGQAIGEDLRQMCQNDPVGTVLSTVLRIDNEKKNLNLSNNIPEKNKYLIIESDPSQEKAVYQSRQVPGILMEGPPGTGKSQTIVNIIADNIGNKQTVLVICQKSSALEVIAKRLNAEGIGNRFFYITNVNKDRAAVINAIRSQLAAMSHAVQAEIKSLHRNRNELAEKIEKLENEIDKHHFSVHAEDEITGLSYRMLLGQLLDVENTKLKIINVPALRKLLGEFDRTRVSEFEEACSLLAKVWFESCFEDNPLEQLKNFSSDKAVIEDFSSSLLILVEQENQRDIILSNQSTDFFDVEDILPHQEWIEFCDMPLKKVNWKYIIAWFRLFSDSQSKGFQIIEDIQALKKELFLLNTEHHDSRFSKKLSELPSDVVNKWHLVATAATITKSFWSRFNIYRLMKLRQVQKILISLDEDPSNERVIDFQNSVSLEIKLRPIRKSIIKHVDNLYQNNEIKQPVFLLDVKNIVDQVEADLLMSKNGILAICSCPRHDEVEKIEKTGQEAYQDLISKYEEAFLRYQTRFGSKASLHRLEPYFSDILFEKCKINISNNRSNMSILQSIVDYLPTVSAYQEFRLRMQELPLGALKVFSALREKDSELREYKIDQLKEVVRNTITREALLAWKDRIEQKFPLLRQSQDDLSRKIQMLDESNMKIKKFNQNILINDIDIEIASSSVKWEDLTRLRGPRARGLREIIEQGRDIGLMRLRPVWLMNPNTASQLLPLTSGMFDVVIYDEASQIPIENALPTLYRAKRAVISGDDKQMPPTNLFVKRLEEDEEDNDYDDEFDNTVSELVRIELEDKWNRKEIKDYTDLLALGKSMLPNTMLQIHYRSKYRELIEFSNKAYYGGKLSIPVRHPDSVIQNIRPIEVVHVDGIYSSQTNKHEAEKVVELLDKIWNTSERPSIGVVTFNSKQTDLIEDVLDAYAEKNLDFRRTLSLERDRQQGGEDTGFFVKNVENVQGDERDIIIFSSTFGRDDEGKFRRNFGLLGQRGGERRLNVAITRAREKIILVTSMPINEISDFISRRRSPKTPRDYLQAYFLYASKLNEGSLKQARNVLDSVNFEGNAVEFISDFNKDGFIRSVSGYIRSLGLSPMAIDENDAFGLDFVIEDTQEKRFGIGIECDAHRHPILETARAREIWRPKVLNKGIPQIHRVSSYAWYHDRNNAMEQLKLKIEYALGVTLADTKDNNLMEFI